ncbi:MAG: hypothetical protein IPM66_00230 [Acidobacteriota bacterium]|nr:MAG: hypothetical protein IPM66_00230 [Acidobacteriota bacterium]
MRAGKTRLVAVMIAVWFCLVALNPGSGSTHEPITTKVMFNKEVVRLLEKNCLACHSPGRIKADIPLTTYEEARPWAKAIKEEILEKRMIPFQAVRGYGAFTHDFTMPQREVDMLVSWIEGGAPRGDIKEYPEELRKRLERNRETAWEAGEPDLVIQPANPVRIKSEDEVRCVAIPAPVEGSIRGFDFRPGNGTVVRSAEFLIDSSGRKSTDECPKEGDARIEFLGNWVPGQPGITLPGDATVPLPKGSKIILRINYQTNGEEAIDQSRLALYLNKAGAGRAIRSLSIRPDPVTVPANDANYRLRTSLKLNESTEVVAVRPLIYPYAKSLEATAFLPNGGVEVLIWVRNYRYDWQPTYYFRNPVTLPKGARIVLTAYLDNSDANRNLTSDPGTPLKFDSQICRLTLIENAAARQARR